MVRCEITLTMEDGSTVRTNATTESADEKLVSCLIEESAAAMKAKIREGK